MELKIAGIIIVAILLASLLAAMAVCQSTHRLFNGEFVIKPDGIYTYAHYYEHPDTKRKVIIVGMNHGGDKEYFEKVAKILEECQVVLYEGVPPEKEETKEEFEKAAKEYLLDLESDDVDKAFDAAMPSYFIPIAKYLNLSRERKSFDYKKTGWESGDAEFFLKFKDDKKMQEEFISQWRKDYERLTPEYKKEAVEYVKAALKKIEAKQFTKKDFGDGFVFFWSNPVLVTITLSYIGEPRDKMVLEKFDKIMREKNPETIGIKFGAGHIPQQRKFLEQRGYVHQYSIELYNLTF